MKHIQGASIPSLDSTQRQQLYEHIAYEFASAFCIPDFGSSAELKESVYMRVMVAIRNIYHFFSFEPHRSYNPLDVFAWQFFPDQQVANKYIGRANSPKIEPKEINKISKQIAHISLARTSIVGTQKQWNVDLRNELTSHVLHFMEDLFDCHANEIPEKPRIAFQRLRQFVNGTKYCSIPLTGSTSNTAFTVTVISPQATPPAPLSIVELLHTK